MTARLSKILSPIAGVACILVGLIAFCFGLAAIVDGFGYSALHQNMRLCSDFVESHSKQHQKFPSDSELEAWRNERRIAEPFSIAGPDGLSSYDRYESRSAGSPATKFRIAYWDGDRFEFYQAWDQVATSKPWNYRWLPALFALAALVITMLLYSLRQRLRETPTANNAVHRDT